MLKVPCAALSVPNVLYNGKVAPYQAGSTWDLRDVKLTQTRSDWELKIYTLVQEYKLDDTKSHPSGFNPKLFWKSHATAQRYKAELENIINKYDIGKLQWSGHLDLDSVDFDDINLGMSKAKKSGANCVLLILKKKDVSAYSIFKDLADRCYGLQAICLTEDANWQKSKKEHRPLQGYFGNIAMKLNLKMTGVNQAIGQLDALYADTLVLGAHVTHPSSGAISGCPSIAAIVGSVDNWGRYRGSMRLQDRENKEVSNLISQRYSSAFLANIRQMIDEVVSMVEERIRDWSETNKKKLPTNILYYRDGVSEGQYAQVKHLELEKIRTAFNNVATGGETFNLIAIVAAKRHHTRFYPDAKKDMDRTDKDAEANCQPGTLVDQVVTSPFFTDFYLQSHKGLEGTARPTHYFVLENESDWGVKTIVEHVSLHTSTV